MFSCGNQLDPGGANYIGFYSGGTVELNQWNHVSVVRNMAENKMYWYINGELTNTETINIPGGGGVATSTDHISLGKRPATSNDGFTGGIGEFRIWAEARTGGQINSYMNEVLTGKEDHLRACFRFDEGSGQVVLDSSPYQHNGVIGGSTTVASDDPERKHYDVFEIKNIMNASPWYASGESQEMIYGNGSVEWTIGGDALDKNHNIQSGLSYERGQGRTNINYSINTSDNGNLEIKKDDQLISSNHTYAMGDVLKIERKDGMIYYYKNDVLLTTLAESSSHMGEPLLFDFTMSEAAKSLYNVKLNSAGYGNENGRLAYRYGFNGQERDNEWKGDGNSIAYEARIYDPRLGKFLSTDPWESKYAWQTPYAYYKNSPIAYIDWNGYGEPPSWGEGFLVSTLKGIGGFYSYMNNNPAHAGYSLRSNKITEQQIQAYSINWSQQLDPYYQIQSYAAGTVGMFKGFGQFWVGVYTGDGAMSAQAMPDVVSMIMLAYSGYRLSVPKPRLSNPRNFTVMDLTKSVLISKSYLKEIQIERVISMIKKFSKESGFLIDWDKGDGEQWGRLLQEKRVVALFNAELPLFFVDNKFYHFAVQYFEDNELDKLVILNVESWESTDNCIDISAVSDVINWNSATILGGKFSINDFWFATV